MAEDLRRRLASLEREALDLRAELEEVSGELRRIAEERASLKGRVKDLRREAAEFRGERNALNEKVKNLKLILAELKREYDEKAASLRDLRRRVREHLRMKPARSEESLREEIEKIDWEIQTGSLPLEEERKLVERVKSLEKQLSFYRRLHAMRDEISTLESRLKEIKDEISSCRERIAEAAAKSQIFHEKMVEALRRVGELKPKLEEVERRFRESRRRLLDLRLKYRGLKSQISTLRRAIREEEERRRAEALSALKEKIGREALEKLRRGEKISLEEFKILAEQGKIWRKRSASTETSD